MILKEKRYGTIKGHGIADGGKQLEKIKLTGTTSPTVSTDVVMLTATIEALEGRYVAMVGIPGSYLSANMDDEVHMVFRGMPAELMVAADPELYRTFVSYATGQAIMYVQLQKSLY